uniref:Peptidase_M14 domain-containing protein n=1 Tax=Heterorhabditis bacteriophora TaxID=37862 RepID=A0A1I7WVV3_HETBA
MKDASWRLNGTDPALLFPLRMVYTTRPTQHFLVAFRNDRKLFGKEPQFDAESESASRIRSRSFRSELRSIAHSVHSILFSSVILGATMVDFMMKLSEQRPDLVSLLNISKTFEGRTIYGLKGVDSSSCRPLHDKEGSIFYYQLQENYSSNFKIILLKINFLQLVTGYGIDEKITRSVDKFDWYIIPEANPDGYEYSRTQDRLWRKTRSRNVTVNKWCVGADANRNWGYRWGEAGANRSPCSNIYAGSHPFSEPEIVGMIFYMYFFYSAPWLHHIHVNRNNLLFNLASFKLLLSPWGYTNMKPENYMDQRNAARAAVNAMKNATGANYNYGTISELMYSHDSYAFSLPPKYIKPTGVLVLIFAFHQLSLNSAPVFSVAYYTK